MDVSKIMDKKKKGYDYMKVIRKKDSIGDVLPFILEEPSHQVVVEWETVNNPNRAWNQVETECKENKMLDTKCKTKYGYSIELGRNDIPYSAPIPLVGPITSGWGIEYEHKDIAFYKDFISNRDHTNFMAEVEGVGAVIVTLDTVQSGHRTRCIVHTKHGAERIYIPVQYTNTKDMLKFVRTNFPKFSKLNSDIKWHQIYDRELVLDLIEMERKEIVQKYKIGVLYVADGQTNEDEMFSNVTGSEDFEEFLSVLGEKIPLKGFTGFTGGLDVKTDTTGTHSIYTKHRGFELMFHVSTMLPFQAEDKQRVERKRHIGNDVVVVIFKEGNTPFDPLILTSQFNHAFIVVQVESKNNNVPVYRVGVANKPGVQPYGPFIPDPPLFEKSAEFKDFILTKLINAERGAMCSPEFKAKLMSTRRSQLEDLISKYMNQSKDKSKRKSGAAQDFQSSPSTPRRSPPVAPATPASTSEEIVNLGKKLFNLSSANDFDTGIFRSLLQQLLQWTVSNERGSSLTSSGEPDELIELAKHIVRSGKSYADLQENKRKGLDNPEKLAQAQEQFQKNLSAFFHSFKDITIDIKLPTPSKHQRPKSFDPNTFPPRSEHKEKDSPKRIKSLKSFKTIDEPFEHTEDLIVQTLKCLSAPTFNAEHFGELLVELGSMIKQLTSVLDEEQSKQLVSTAKLVLQQGVLLKSAPANLLTLYRKQLNDSMQQFAGTFREVARSRKKP